MRDFNFYDKLSELNDSLYTKVFDFGNWKLVNTFQSPSGLFIALYDIGNNETLFCVKGTDFCLSINSIFDLMEDVELWITKTNQQFRTANKFFKQISSKYKNIIFTGYSLGGSIAQKLGVLYGNETICFQPFATGGQGNNIINFGNVYDIFFMQRTDHPGKVYLIPVKPHLKFRNIETHLPSHHGLPSNGILINKNILENNLHYLMRMTNLVVNNPTKLNDIIDARTKQLLIQFAQKHFPEQLVNLSKYVRKGLLQASQYL